MTTLHAQQRAALEQAAGWFSTLQCEDVSPADQAGWQTWLASDAHNRWAWAQIQQLQQRLHGMPAALTGRALTLADQTAGSGRRTVLKGLALAMGSGMLGYASYQQGQSAGWLAAYRTRTGEQHNVVLADGSQLQLNTATAVDVAYSRRERRVILRQGELMLTSAADPARRPLLVQTEQGSVQALGTRFSVLTDGAITRVAVFEHQVRISPLGAAAVIIEAGSQCSFASQHIRAPQPVSPGQDGWSQGVLVANDQRLDTFLLELGRYRAGWLRCDPAIAGLRISGAFNVHDTEQALQALSTTLPVRVVRATRYWVNVVPG
ncbi:FecR domain-containing protein [Pseudomonas sp. BP8]|uniref:FecR domain-containing protein n=1 Tax=Pseudomonas sp. BP8 TaxID=2817864 RepID=UPI001AE69178|nr:FecR domain-containing protein [Pseudomonas sp. BP8]MBP2261852.1 transmembrane sensor [Pseudomonas sp. BP8]HDS1737302.1 FecR domain-containing protein [Pseudomonas putida]